MKKQETFQQKSNRVYKELNTLLRSDKKITKLTEDQRYILLVDRADDKHKYFNFPNASNKNHWDVELSPETLKEGFEYALNNAIEWAKDNKLTNVSYGIGDNNHNSIEAVGYKPISDQELITIYTKNYIAYQKMKEREKQEAKEAKKQKSVIIGNKKYKLVEVK